MAFNKDGLFSRASLPAEKSYRPTMRSIDNVQGYTLLDNVQGYTLLDNVQGYTMLDNVQGYTLPAPAYDFLT